MSLFDQKKGNKKEIIESTFKTTRIVNGQSVMNVPQNNLLLVVSHHFGAINQGPYELFGLDQATMRLGFEYGLTDRLTIAVGRSTFEKTYDGFIKSKIIKQSKGENSFPFSVSYFSSVAINSTKWLDPLQTNFFSSRLAFVQELLVARKFSDKLSLQLIPAIVHKNLVKKSSENNDVFALGSGGRFKINSRTSINAEYYFVLPQPVASNTNSLSLGMDIETGGHVFQIFLTNSMGIFERNFITENTGKWTDGDVFIGFNITRIFALKRENKLIY